MELSQSLFRPAAHKRTAIIPGRLRHAAQVGAVRLAGAIQARARARTLFRPEGQAIADRFGRFLARLHPLELALRQSRPGAAWQLARHVHLALRLELASLSMLQPGEPTSQQGSERIAAQPGRYNPRSQAVLRYIERIVRQVQAASPLAERLHTRSAAGRSRTGVETDRQPALTEAPQPPPALPVRRRSVPGASPVRPAERVLLRQPAPLAAASTAGNPAPPLSGPAAPAVPRPAQSGRPPHLHIDQLPAHEVDRLADRVVQTIDRRILAQRERLGRR